MKAPLLVAVLLFHLHAFAADLPRVLPPGELPHDARLGPLKELDGYFPFTPPASREAWESRADEVRMQMRVALGIWPEPTKTPLNGVIHSRIEREDYTVEKVFFESMPGFFVTGQLYRPRGRTGRVPGVLCPYGHWPNGRFMDTDDKTVEKQFEMGAEKFRDAAHSPLQARCVQLARMGCVVFHYDMIGRGDSLQLSGELAHGFAKQRPEMNTRENWGLFSPQAEAHAQSIMGLQTWSSIRALDFLESLPDVDPQRLACTGASGGGTQTMILAALDPRLAAAFPAVMVSTAMQGGCTCENASLLRVGTGNVEFAALFAPKPMGMTAADDWTKQMETKGFPELKQHWTMLGAPDHVRLWPLIQFPHNYNAVSRAAMSGWFNQHLGLGLSDAQLEERDFKRLTRDEMSVWDAAHPAPAGGDDFERKLLKWWHDDAQAQIAKSPEELARIGAPAWKALIGWAGDRKGKLEHSRETTVTGQGKNYRAMLFTCRADEDGFDLPRLTIDPATFSGHTALWLDERGKAGLFAASGELRPEICRLLEAGWRVEGVDVFAQGEFLADGQPITETRRTKNPREAAAYTFGYNPALFAQRVHDVCQTLSQMGLTKAPTQRAVVALDGTGPLAAVALAVLSDKIERAVVNTGGFRFGSVLDLRSPNFLPAAAKYGDLPGALALARRNVGRVLVIGEGETGSADSAVWLLENAKP